MKKVSPETIRRVMAELGRRGKGAAKTRPPEVMNKARAAAWSEAAKAKRAATLAAKRLKNNSTFPLDKASATAVVSRT